MTDVPLPLTYNTGHPANQPATRLAVAVLLPSFNPFSRFFPSRSCQPSVPSSKCGLLGLSVVFAAIVWVFPTANGQAKEPARSVDELIALKDDEFRRALDDIRWSVGELPGLTFADSFKLAERCAADCPNWPADAGGLSLTFAHLISNSVEKASPPELDRLVRFLAKLRHPRRGSRSAADQARCRETARDHNHRATRASGCMEALCDRRPSGQTFCRHPRARGPTG